MNIIDYLRTPRLFDIAIFDFFVVFVIIYFISDSINNKYKEINRNKLDFILILISLIIGIIVHKIFNINTKLNYYLGISDDPRQKK